MFHFLLDVPGAHFAKAHDDDAAFDLCASEPVWLPSGARTLVKTGLHVAIPDGHAGLVLPRSGLAFRHGVTVLNAPGLVDPGYRGDVGVVLINLGSCLFTASPGDRIAQLMLVRTADLAPVQVDSLPESDRGTGGFGSTGR